MLLNAFVESVCMAIYLVYIKNWDDEPPEQSA